MEELRAIAPEALHATLCFLGWREASEIGPIGTACAGAVAVAAEPKTSFGDAIWLPRRRPSVLAVELRDEHGELERIQTAVAASLSAGGWYVPEARPFFAHVTVARVRRRSHSRAIDLQAVPSLDFAGPSITLYRSRLGPAGAHYEPLRAISLGRAARPDLEPIDGKEP
jgi:2'-5' RNA ligase